MTDKTRYRIFKRRWWADRACTIPGPGRKITVDTVVGYEAARRACKRMNLEAFGAENGRGPYGLAHEFEAVS